MWCGRSTSCTPWRVSVMDEALGSAALDGCGDLARRRGSALGELAAEAGVAGGIEQGVDLRRRETRAHVRILGEHLAEWSPLCDRGLSRVVDRVVRPLPSDLLAELQHERLGHDQTAGEIEVLAHPSGEHLEPAEEHHQPL